MNAEEREQHAQNMREWTDSIYHGNARVPASCVNGEWGWILPGRVFTKSKQAAVQVALKMARLMA